MVLEKRSQKTSSKIPWAKGVQRRQVIKAAVLKAPNEIQYICVFTAHSQKLQNYASEIPTDKPPDTKNNTYY